MNRLHCTQRHFIAGRKNRRGRVVKRKQLLCRPHAAVERPRTLPNQRLIHRNTQIKQRVLIAVQALARIDMDSPWIGFYQIQRFTTNVKFWKILSNTLFISLYNLVAGFPIPILLAIGLTHMMSDKYRKTIQMVTYAPHFLSTVIMVGLLNQLLSLHNGLLNRMLELFGANAVNFLGKPEYFRHVYVWSGVWQEAGYGAIIYISALAGVDPQLHEAASIDGASMWKRIWHVDIPGILPTITIMLILRMGSVITVGFEKIYLMQNSTNISLSEVIETYVYKQSITASKPDFSYSTAVGLFQNLVSLFLVLTANFFSTKISNYGLW